MTMIEDSICVECRSYLSLSTTTTTTTNSSTIAEEDKKQTIDDDVCVVCMDLWNYQDDALEKAMETACAPYGGLKGNRFACQKPNHVPTVSISGDIYLRYHYWQSASTSTGTLTRTNRPSRPFSAFLHDLKQHLQKKIHRIIAPTDDDSKDAEDKRGLLNDQEQGYLRLHILCVPPKDMKATAGDDNDNASNKKRKRGRKKLFRTQGGDPLAHLEARLEAQEYSWPTTAQAEAMVSSATPSNKPEETKPMEYHVAAYRRPLFLFGYYTKCRRDVSQTPFIVDGGKTALGVTSVEEQICEPIIDLLGVSQHNNPPVLLDDNNNNSHNNSNIQYGMCKFHASGREDMDVRMMIRPNSSTKGRPFCIQFVDALRPIESTEQLQQLVASINQGDSETSTMWYGKNPMGVGISDDFKVVRAEAFSGLQADTETKVKHYGCHCWSEKELSEDWILPATIEFPLQIAQKTPLRVLHRRANAIRERQVLAGNAKRLDEHHFRLELSTQAGTYVKEFVHGDLMRTTPSLASLLGCKTNLLQLDCEGIQIDEETADE